MYNEVNVTNQVSNNFYEWQLYKFYPYAVTSGLLLEDKINPIIPKTNMSKNHLAEISSKMLNDIISLMRKFSDSNPIINRKYFKFSSNINSNLVGYGYRVLKNAGIITLSRKGTIKGANRISVNFSRLKEIEDKGVEFEKNRYKEYVLEEKEIIEKSKKQIAENKTRIENKWSFERSEAINKMAFSKLTPDTIEIDMYNTGLQTWERIMVIIITKAWYRYTGNILKWDLRMFNKLKSTIAETSLKETSPEDMYRIFSNNFKLQRIIDTVKLTASIWLRPLTECNSKKFELMFADAYNKGLRYIAPTFYNLYSLYSQYDPLKLINFYNEKGIHDFEDKDYYFRETNFSIKTRLKRNEFNYIDIFNHKEIYSKVVPKYELKFLKDYKKYNEGLLNINKDLYDSLYKKAEERMKTFIENKNNCLAVI